MCCAPDTGVGARQIQLVNKGKKKCIFNKRLNSTTSNMVSEYNHAPVRATVFFVGTINIHEEQRAELILSYNVIPGACMSGLGFGSGCT